MPSLDILDLEVDGGPALGLLAGRHDPDEERTSPQLKERHLGRSREQEG